MREINGPEQSAAAKPGIRTPAGDDVIASDEAIEWLARMRAADVTDAERADFAQWLAASDANKAAFDDASTLWYLLGSLPMQLPATAKPSPRYRPQWAFAAAASLLLTCFVFVLQMAASTQDFSTVKGEQRRVTLSDGSTAHLNTDTQITVAYNDDVRRIVLHRGEAWFSVHKNPERPFLVEGTYATAQAVGTAFAVRQTQGFTRVQVTEGTVAVAPTNDDADVAANYLQQGEQNLVTHADNLVKSFDADAALAWQHGQLIYTNVTLADLLADLNRYLPKTMTVNDDALLQARVSAALTLEDQEGMLDALSTVLPIRWQPVSDHLIIITAR